MKLNGHELELLDRVVGALKRGETIEIAEEWISTKEALQILGMRSSEYLLWLTESGHVRRQARDGRSNEYLKESVELAKKKIDTREIVLPNPNKKAA